MRKTKRFLLIGLGVAGLLFIALSLVLRVFLSEEHVTAFVKKAVGTSLRRDVTLGAVRVNLWRGIVVKDLQIMEEDARSPFLSVGEFVLSYQFLPLLSGRLLIDEVRLLEPRIRITKKSDGSFNLPEVTASGKKKETGDDAPSGIPFTLDVKQISIKNALVEYQEAGGAGRSARIGADGEMELSMVGEGAFRSRGRLSVELRELKGTTARGAQSGIRGVQAGLSYEVDLDQRAKKITVKSAVAEISKTKITLGGEVGYGEPPFLSLSVSAPDVQVDNLKGLLGSLLPDGMDVSGRMTAHLKAERKAAPVAQTEISGDVACRDLAISYKGVRPVFNGAISIAPDRLTLKGMKLHAGDSTADLSGSVSNYRNAPEISMNASAKTFNFTPLIPEGPQARGEKTAGQGPGAGEGQKRGTALAKVKAKGVVDVEQALFRGFTIRNLRASYNLNNGTFTIGDLSGSTMQGSFVVKASADLSAESPAYALNAALDGIDLDELLKAFSPKAVGKLSGSLNGRSNISAEGDNPGSVKQSMNGQGNFSIRGGSFRNTEVVNALLIFAGLQDLREIKIEKAEGDFTITRGVVAMKSRIENKDLVILEDGTLGLPDERLAMGIQLKVSERLTPSLLRQPSVAQFLSEERGWTTLPLRLAGTLSKPSYGLDAGIVTRKATEKIKKRFSEELFKALSGEKGREPAGEKKR